mmetsp:Transcript_28022/g.27703  ORF Transcript_28022/g.27703 Transcript_28022/m.27703 type:complete len:156 (-) Transcript_28022:23-490(-)
MENTQNSASGFECHICMETAKEAVVTQCGHLYCWTCISQWLNQNRQEKTCPVCKSGIDPDKMVPIYGSNNKERGNSERPKAQWETPRPNPEYSRFRGFQEGMDRSGINFSAGFGLFPGMFGFSIGTNFNQNDPRADTLSKIMMIIGLLIILAIVF